MNSFCMLGVALMLGVAELGASSVSEFLCPIRNLTVTVDNIMRLYFDGIEITDLPNADNFDQPDFVELPCTTRLIAIHGRSGNTISPAGILASTDDEYVLTNSTWKCSNVSHSGWEEIDFDDSAWMSAVEFDQDGSTGLWLIPEISPNATWIWLRQYISDEEDFDQDVYCRKRLAPSFCTNSPCSFGGTCIQEPNGVHQCICTPGYSGQNCSVVINYCESSPCVNGGSCLTMVDEYTCKCPSGYTGENCEYVADNCVSSPCLNNGTCFNNLNNYMCVCSPEWTGVRCDTLLNPCGSQLCANGGTCFNYCGQPQCACRPGWTGDLCIIYLDPCASNPCQNDGSCGSDDDGWNCTCLPYFTGVRCEQVVDLCANQQCLNGGTCVFDCGDSRCFCPDGWTGVNCQTPITTCGPNPCLNGGTCSNLGGGSFSCNCPTTWTGVKCESANYNESLACGSTLAWSQYDASNGFTRLCHFAPTAGDTDGRMTECRFTINGIPLYDDYTGLLKAGGNFGCLVSHYYPEDLPVTSQLACQDNYQQDISLGNYSESASLMVCLRYPYDGEQDSDI